MVRGLGAGSLRPRPAWSYQTTRVNSAIRRAILSKELPAAPNPISSTTVGCPCPASRNASRRPPISTSRALAHPVAIACVSMYVISSGAHGAQYLPPTVIYQAIHLVQSALYAPEDRTRLSPGK